MAEIKHLSMCINYSSTSLPRIYRVLKMSDPYSIINRNKQKEGSPQWD
jgi:hypothetical protein